MVERLNMASDKHILLAEELRAKIVEETLRLCDELGVTDDLGSSHAREHAKSRIAAALIVTYALPIY